MAQPPHVFLFTDGACSGNPGPGGWAYILRHPRSSTEREMSGADPATTNNRMELLAVIEGLAALDQPSRVEIYSDSSYVLNGLEKWLDQWIGRGWKTASKKPVKNEDLWRQLDTLRAAHQLSLHWVRGHSDHRENERCDQLAVEAREELVRNA